MNRKKSALAILLSLTLILTAFTGCGGATSVGTKADGEKTVIKLRIGAGHTDSTQWIYGLQHYFEPAVADRVAAETDYKIEWTEAYGGTVAKLGEELEAIETGLLDIGCIVNVFEPTKLMVHGMTYRMPFQSSDPVAVSEAARELYKEYPIFEEQLSSYNQKYLSLLVSDDYNLYSNFEIKTVDDLKGHKIAGAGANLKWLEGTGAIGVQSNLTEGYTSMQTGVYEGFLNPTVAQFNYKIHEVGPYLLLANFGVQMVANVTINQQTWDKLPKEVQAILVDEGEKLATWEAEYVQKDYDATLEKLAADKSVFITQLSDAEKTRWANILPNIVGDDLAKELNASGIEGTAIIKAYYKKIQDRGYVMVRDWELPQ